MKKLLFLTTLVCIMPFSSISGNNIYLSVKYTDESPIIGIPHKSPVKLMQINLDNHQLEFNASHPDYTLTLLNEYGDVVYSTVVPAGTSTVTLPATLTGDYELRLYPDGTAYFFYGDITL